VRASFGDLVLFATMCAISAAALAMKSPSSPAHPLINPELATDSELLESRNLLIPVLGIERKALRDNFDERRSAGHKHEALDIMAPRGTPVLAVGDGKVAKLFKSVAGGITVYQFDADEKFAYYYAHLDRYAPGLQHGQLLKRGEVLGYVGSTGNAPAHAPHLHFTIFRLGPDKAWWKGTAVNPYPFLLATS
jgi:peptidoglycan LD-endopeptidase LytH